MRSPLQKSKPYKGLRTFYFWHPHGANTEENFEKNKNKNMEFFFCKFAVVLT